MDEDLKIADGCEQQHGPKNGQVAAEPPTAHACDMAFIELGVVTDHPLHNNIRTLFFPTPCFRRQCPSEGQRLLREVWRRDVPGRSLIHVCVAVCLLFRRVRLRRLLF